MGCREDPDCWMQINTMYKWDTAAWNTMVNFQGLEQYRKTLLRKCTPCPPYKYELLEETGMNWNVKKRHCPHSRTKWTLDKSVGSHLKMRYNQMPIYQNVYDMAHFLICLDYDYFIWSMIQRGSATSLTNIWSLLLYIQLSLHYVENAQENKKNTHLSVVPEMGGKPVGIG